LNLGGAALSVLELAAGQQRRGHNVLVVAGTIPDGERSMEHVAAELGVPYLHVPALRRELAPRSDLEAIQAIRSTILARRADVLHTHTAKAGATGRVAALSTGRKGPGAVVHTFHGHVLSGYFDPRRERAFRLLERALAHASDALIAVSAEVRDDLVRLKVAPRAKFAVIPYGFNFSALGNAAAEQRDAERRDARARLEIPDDAFVLGWAGRLTAIKRPLDLVRVAAGVDGAVLVLVGDGEDREAAESTAAELGVTERVRFLGYRDDLASIYPAFDVFLLTSANEGAPVVLIEALAAGVPVVATAAGGTASVVDAGETGLLAPVGAVEQLQAEVERLRSNDTLRAGMGELGARRMRERFSVERMVDDTDRLYAEILAR
jgi:glycosyltransferase involved in cell wall biosynthesis